MNDTKNIFLAWASSITSVMAALETRDVITIVSAIVLPVIFFTVGKSIDVFIQIYLKRRNDDEQK
ncbi:MAG TPA: hypothetical protein PLL77_01470 [Pyrinomonadaceae bacterium]|nr:hypothetical protein [Pyrinomonadaceae bacterium]